MLLKKTNGGQEVFTLDEGQVTISYPGTLSGESLKDLKDYLDIFYRKACRLQDDPHDPFEVQQIQKDQNARKQLDKVASTQVPSL